MTSIDSARPSLTTNDAAVLQALFDAESSPSSGITINPALPSWPATVNISQEDLQTIKIRETEIIRRLHASEQPTQQTVQSAVDELEALIDEHPTYPSVYTNRAQALRLLSEIQDQEHDPDIRSKSVDDALFTPQAAHLSSRIFEDLGQAITLATPASPADPVSPAQARLLADTHTHRGYLLLKAARIKKTGVFKDEMDVGPDRLRGLTAGELEEMASRDFFMGGRFGNKVAQQLAVQTNPYAKMCGAIVQEAMRKDFGGDLSAS